MTNDCKAQVRLPAQLYLTKSEWVKLIGHIHSGRMNRFGRG